MVAIRSARWWTPAIGRRVIDAVLVMGCLGLTVLAVRTPWSPLPWPVIVAVGGVGSLAQWWRRRWPEVAAVLGAGAMALAANPGAWLVGVYSGATYAPRHRMWLAALAGWLGLTAFLWIDAGELRGGDVLFGAAATAFVAIAGGYLSARRALLAALAERAAQVEIERSLRDERARTAERNRIAREMHDVLAHKVSLIALHAGALEVGAGDDPARVQQGAALIRVTAREALQELRAVLGILHAEPASGAGPDDPLGRGEPFADLASLVRESIRAGQPVELRDRAGPLPPATARVIYRVVQEGLTNAHRYAPNAQTTVSVERDPDGDHLTVTVRNAAGADPPADLPGSGSGLVGLAERIRLVGGSLDSGPLGPSGRDGWRLRAVIPWLDPGVEEHPAALVGGADSPAAEEER
jgi:signal transduction histidine kinase